MPGQPTQRPTLLPGGLDASQRPELSVVIPAHNEEPSLAQALGQIADQSAVTNRLLARSLPDGGASAGFMGILAGQTGARDQVHRPNRSRPGQLREP